MSSAPLPSTIHSKYIVRRAQASEMEAVIRLAEKASTSARWPLAAYSAYSTAERQASDTQVKALFVACLLAEDLNLIAHRHKSQLAKGNIVGFAAFSAVTDAGAGECELENMAVAEKWRRQGVGRRLMGAGLLWCRTWCPANKAASGSGLWLEVRASNRGAIAFYERSGFTVAGRRPAYYAQPTEDAILMRKPFNRSLPAC